MRLSTTTRYGLSALSDLCSHSHNGPVSVSDIAGRQNIPVNYLEQLFAKLRRGGLLTSVRGAQGGYMLAKPACEITISDIISALGEPIIFGECQTDNGCVQAPTCPTFHLWRRVKGSIDEILDGTTLEDIFNQKVSLIEESITDPVREEVRNRALKRESEKMN